MIIKDLSPYFAPANCRFLGKTWLHPLAQQFLIFHISFVGVLVTMLSPYKYPRKGK